MRRLPSAKCEHVTYKAKAAGIVAYTACWRGGTRCRLCGMGPNRPKRRQVASNLAEVEFAAVGQDGGDGHDVVAHDAVADRACTARIIARHAANGGTAGGRNVDGKPKPRRSQLAIEILEHNARFDHAGAGAGIDANEPFQI